MDHSSRILAPSGVSTKPGELHLPLVVIDPDDVCGPVWSGLSFEYIVVRHVTRVRALARYEPWQAHGVCVAAGPFCEDTVREIRAFPYAGPVVVVGDRCRGLASLASGADDFVGPEVTSTELRARLVAIGRRSGPYVTGGLVVDPLSHRSWLDGRELRLRTSDAALLVLLAARAGSVVPTRELIRSLRAEGPVHRSAVAVAIARIRGELEASRDLLETVEGEGYGLRFVR
jgi:two-component system response regulator MprA